MRARATARGLARGRSLRSLIALALASSALPGCAHVDVGPEGSPAVWNLSPRRDVEVDHAALCCPREGGLLWVSAVVSERGVVADLRVERPPAWAALLAGGACGLADGVWLVAHVAGDDGAAHQADALLASCDEGKKKLGGSWLPPSVSAVERRCFEGMTQAWAREHPAPSSPVTFTLSCVSDPGA